MTCHRLAAIAAGGLLLLAAAVSGEPMVDQPASIDAGNIGEGWGDPEELEEPEPGWTWFGMGYERRTRDSGAEVLGAPQKPADPQDNGGKGK